MSKTVRIGWKNNIIRFAGLVAIIILVNTIGQNWFFRIDLTTEKRYSLSGSTKQILKQLDDIVFFRIYLDGELNIPFKKFQNDIRDILDEFKVYGRSMIQYEFINPYDNVPTTMQNRVIEQLYNQGLKPTNIHQRNKEGGVIEKIIFPGAMVLFKEVEIPLNLLINIPGLPAEQNLNHSVEVLEHALISAIRNITNPYTEKIAFIEGHGELSEPEVHDISVELSKSFQIDRGVINGMPGVLDEYKAVIVAKPEKPFSEPDKFVLDQYIMNGGKILWLIDAVTVSLDSLIKSETLAFIANLNLEDMFFRYGVRILPELVQDIQCNVIPINVALTGNPPDFRPAPWLYYPLAQPNPNHPVSQNLNYVLCRFASPIDTIAARKNIRKTTLLTSSPLSRTKKVPSMISLEEIKNVPAKTDFDNPGIIMGILLEGEFESVFTNRGIDTYFETPPQVREKSVHTKMVILSDGDIIRNDITASSGGTTIHPLGFDRFTRQTFGNKDFLMNVIQYLTDDIHLIELRGREFKLRLLDKEKISSERQKWIWLNMLLPSLAILLFGAVYMYYRKYRYTR